MAASDSEQKERNTPGGGDIVFADGKLLKSGSKQPVNQTSKVALSKRPICFNEKLNLQDIAIPIFVSHSNKVSLFYCRFVPLRSVFRSVYTCSILEVVEIFIMFDKEFYLPLAKSHSTLLLSLVTIQSI